jgi:hypothetical protein
MKEERSCIWISGTCYDVKKDCTLINDSVICETRGSAINETDNSILECVWISNDDDSVNGKCILRVCS